MLVLPSTRLPEEVETDNMIVLKDDDRLQRERYSGGRYIIGDFSKYRIHPMDREVVSAGSGDQTQKALCLTNIILKASFGDKDTGVREYSRTPRGGSVSPGGSNSGLIKSNRVLLEAMEKEIEKETARNRSSHYGQNKDIAPLQSKYWSGYRNDGPESNRRRVHKRGRSRHKPKRSKSPSRYTPKPHARTPGFLSPTRLHSPPSSLARCLSPNPPLSPALLPRTLDLNSRRQINPNKVANRLCVRKNPPMRYIPGYGGFDGGGGGSGSSMAVAYSSQLSPGQPSGKEEDNEYVDAVVDAVKRNVKEVRGLFPPLLPKSRVSTAERIKGRKELMVHMEALAQRDDEMLAKAELLPEPPRRWQPFILRHDSPTRNTKSTFKPRGGAYL